MKAWSLERAWAAGEVRDDVRVEVEDGRFTLVEPGGRRDGATRLPGLTLPGFANTHSHAFHRVLRSRTQAERGTFWTWRDQMYAVAARLDPDTYFDLAKATYREMVAAGMTSVGEFHYLHHRPDGRPYGDPNAMGHALIAAAAEAGIRLTLLDTLYLSSGFGKAPTGVQVRYDDKSASQWAHRVQAIKPGDAKLGAAIHSVRAVPVGELTTLMAWAGWKPLHVHLSEQVAENEACQAAHGCTPTELLHDHGVLGPLTSAVHATHLTSRDIKLLGSSGTFAAFCPTTERDLGDGVGPSRALAAAGSRLTLGSDSHAVIDHFEEMRAVEMDERLATQERGHWSAAELLDAATVTGHESLGWSDAGTIAVGCRADLVTVDTTSPRTAGTGAGAETAVYAAGARDVRQVVVEGRVAYTRDDAEDVGRALDLAIRKVVV